MKIGWMIRSGGIFGSVREAIEVGNALNRRGHEFTMYVDQGKDCMWLPNTINWKHTKDAAIDPLDVMFWSDSPDEPYYGIFKQSPAKLKAFCVMGFDPAQAGEKFFSDKHHDIITNYWTIVDGAWQIELLRRYTDDIGPAIGGINTQQFRPQAAPQTADVVWSGDMRERKGGVAVMKAIKGLREDSYSKKRVSQADMAAYICRAPIFVDGHKRGGWCNPVMEAMACGRAVVCTDTPCNSDFAVHEVNCLKAPVDDHVAMRTAINRLMKDKVLARKLAHGALVTSRSFGYNTVAFHLEQAIQKRMPV